MSKVSERSEKKVRHVANFNDLPDEIILLICHYLSPVEVLKIFLHYDQRLSRCIWEYRQNIDLTKSSCFDFEYFANMLADNVLHPSKLTVSNARIPNQITAFLNTCNSPIVFYPISVQDLSLLECTEYDVCQMSLFLHKFQSLHSLNIVQSISDKTKLSMNYAISEQFRQSIFNSSTMLTELELTTNDGIILDKQLRPNEYLTRLLISLQDINDLFVLLAGLVPNLHFLRATVCQSDINKRSSLPKSWPNQSMSQLRQFQLVTTEKVPFTFDQFRSIVMPLTQLNTFTLVISQWKGNNEQFIEGYQLEMLIEKFLPQLHYFDCSIYTTSNINMQTFATMSERWPMKCALIPKNKTYKHLYTVPWSLLDLYVSTLANDDTTSICPAVQSLIIDTVCSNLSHRFPDIKTLTIQPGYDLPSSDYIAFRQLRHLTITNIDQAPSSVIRRLHSLTLSVIDELVNHPVIYSNVKYLNVKGNQIGSSALLTALVQHFPRLHTLEIQLEQNADYYDSLDMLLNEEHLPHLSLLKTNWIDHQTYCSNINLWLTAKTSLKWRSTPFYGHYDRNCLTICL